MKYNPKITGQIIGCMRVKRSMTQQELAARAQVARSHLAMIESGYRSANVETLWRIAQALDLRLSELLRMVEDEIERLTFK